MKRIFISFVLSFLLVGCQPSPEKIQEAIKQTQSAIPTLTVTPTPPPTNTPKPTNTPQPTNTPKPTATATEKIILEPITFEGSGDSVIDFIVNWGDASLLEVENSGSSNFIVKSYDSNGEYLDLLVNTIGQYRGTLIIDVYSGEDTQRLEIKSSGNWKITAYPIEKEYLHVMIVPGKHNGNGDDVLFLAGDHPDIGTFTNEEDTNFIVWGLSNSGMDLLINEIGPYSGTIILDSTTVMLEIHTEGNWTIETKAK